MVAVESRTNGRVNPELPVSMLARGVIGWIHLFGAVNFELFGRLNTLVEARETYIRHQMREIARLIGL
ncbi:hypothetical protein [Parafrankia soli]|uniref:hypothetical protein n=1 Tax=Parafrankia soli TaxID=2599596 RepID=UPI0010422A6F|nr:hypothetical protein [Parafrankia soli]